jgi:succinoglycan biosynthesis transport protein ExoP
MTPESTGTQDLRTYLRILWRWKLLFLLFLVVIPVGAYLIERGKPKVYESSTLIELQQGSQLAGVPVASGNLLAVARLVNTTPIARRAALFIRPRATPGSISGGVSASADLTTGFLTITDQAGSPRRAAAIANAYAKALGSYQTAQVIHTIDLQIAALTKQLATVPSNSASSSSRASLVQQIGQLRSQVGATGAGAAILERAVANPNAVGPNTRRAVEFALVIALLLGIGAVLVAENSDRRLRSPEDLERLTGLPLLGVIPPSAFSPDSEADPRSGEAFHMLRAALTYFNVDRPIKSVAIVSPLPADGKTTVAVGLALAAARAGKRAIILDADLRRPQVCSRLGIEASDGLGAVLAGERELVEVMFELAVDSPGGGSLIVVPAGGTPPNPSALLASQQMRNVLAELELLGDLVVIDTAAALAVSDALPLLQAASGVAMVVRMNRSSTAAVRRLLKVISSAHSSLLGVVATGTSAAAGGYGDADAYYKQKRRDGAGRGHGPFGRRRSGAARRKVRRANAVIGDSPIYIRPIGAGTAENGGSSVDRSGVAASSTEAGSLERESDGQEYFGGPPGAQT